MAERPDEDVRAALEAAERIDAMFDQFLARYANEQGPVSVDPAFMAYYLSDVREAVKDALSTPVPEEGLPRGTASAAEQPSLVSAQDDPVRRAAYQQAMSRLANRVGLSDRFTASMRPELRQYDGPELIGSHELLPKTGSGAASALPSPLPSQGEPVAEPIGYTNSDELADIAADMSGLFWAKKGWSAGIPLYTAEALAAAARAEDVEVIRELRGRVEDLRAEIRGHAEALAAAEARADRAEEDEREACASIAQGYVGTDWGGSFVARTITDDIRARNILKETPHGER